MRWGFSIKEESSDKHQICNNLTIRVVVCVSLFLVFCSFVFRISEEKHGQNTAFSRSLNLGRDSTPSSSLMLRTPPPSSHV